MRRVQLLRGPSGNATEPRDTGGGFEHPTTLASPLRPVAGGPALHAMCSDFPRRWPCAACNVLRLPYGKTGQPSSPDPSILSSGSSTTGSPRSSNPPTALRTRVDSSGTEGIRRTTQRRSLGDHHIVRVSPSKQHSDPRIGCTLAPEPLGSHAQLAHRSVCDAVARVTQLIHTPSSQSDATRHGRNHLPPPWCTGTRPPHA